MEGIMAIIKQFALLNHHCVGKKHSGKTSTYLETIFQQPQTFYLHYAV